MKALAFAMMAALLGCATSAGIHPKTFEREAADATVVLISLDGGYGSGVVVAQNKTRALILTANHVIRDLSPEEFTIEQRSPTLALIQLKPLSGAKVVKRDVELDLVLIETKPIWPCVAKVARLQDLQDEIVAYAQCFVFGYPITGGLPPKFVFMTDGYISSMAGASTRMHISAPIVFGNSGGGVWVMAGGRLTLAGVVHTVYTVDGSRSHLLFHHGTATKPFDLIEFLNRKE